MLQKRKITAWMLLASLIVMSVFVGSFATSTTPTYAKSASQSSTASVVIERATNSTVGSVSIEIQDSNGIFLYNQCTSIPNQNSPYTIGTWNSNLNVTVYKYGSGNCWDGPGVNTIEYQTTVGALPNPAWVS